MANEENHIPDHIYISPYNGTWSRERLDETYVEYTLTSEVTSMVERFVAQNKYLRSRIQQLMRLIAELLDAFSPVNDYHIRLKKRGSEALKTTKS